MLLIQSSIRLALGASCSRSATWATQRRHGVTELQLVGAIVLYLLLTLVVSAKPKRKD